MPIHKYNIHMIKIRRLRPRNYNRLTPTWLDCFSDSFKPRTASKIAKIIDIKRIPKTEKKIFLEKFSCHHGRLLTPYKQDWPLVGPYVLIRVSDPDTVRSGVAWIRIRIRYWIFFYPDPVSAPDPEAKKIAERALKVRRKVMTMDRPKIKKATICY